MRSRILLIFYIFVLAYCEVYRTDDGFGDGLIGQTREPLEQQINENAVKQKSFKHSHEDPIPWENLKETAQPPVPNEDTEDHVREMFAKLAKSGPDGVLQWIIPIGIFQRIKNMHMSSFEENQRAVLVLHTELTTRAKRKASRFLTRNPIMQASFESLELGNCSFVPPNKDFNRLAFWSCEKNRIYYHLDGERKNLEIRKLINWGRTWYLLEW